MTYVISSDLNLFAKSGKHISLTAFSTFLNLVSHSENLTNTAVWSNAYVLINKSFSTSDLLSSWGFPEDHLHYLGDGIMLLLWLPEIWPFRTLFLLGWEVSGITWEESWYNQISIWGNFKNIPFLWLEWNKLQRENLKLLHQNFLKFFLLMSSVPTLGLSCVRFCCFVSPVLHLDTGLSPDLHHLNPGNPSAETAVIWPVSCSCWCSPFCCFLL